MSTPLMPPRLGTALRYLAIGDARYLTYFGDQPADFLASLAPFLAFPLVTFLILVFGGQWLDGATALFAALSSLLAPPVIAEFFCHFWQRDAHWAKFATVMNWSRWLLLLGVLVVAVIVQLLSAVNANGLALLVVLGFVLYAVWLNMFMARSALAISWGRALVLCLCIGAGTAAVTILPDYQQWILQTPGK